LVTAWDACTTALSVLYHRIAGSAKKNGGKGKRIVTVLTDKPFTMNVDKDDSGDIKSGYIVIQRGVEKENIKCFT